MESGGANEQLEELLQDQYLLQQSLATLESEIESLVGEQDRLSAADANWLQEQQRVVRQYKDYLKRLDALMAADNSKQLTFQSEDSTTNMLVRRSTRITGLDRPRFGSIKFTQQVIFDEIPPISVQPSAEDEDVHTMFGGGPPSPKAPQYPPPVAITPVRSVPHPATQQATPAPAAPTSAASGSTTSTASRNSNSGAPKWGALPTSPAPPHSSTSTHTSSDGTGLVVRGSKDGTLGRGSFLGQRNSSAGGSGRDSTVPHSPAQQPSPQPQHAHPQPHHSPQPHPSPQPSAHHQPSSAASRLGSTPGSGNAPSSVLGPPPTTPTSAAALLAAFNAGAQRPGAPPGGSNLSALLPQQSAGSVAAKGVASPASNFKSPTNVEQPIGAPNGIMWGFLGKRGGLIDANNKLGKILAKTVEDWQVRWVVVDNAKSMCYYGVIDASRAFTKKGEFGLKMATVTRVGDTVFAKQGVFKVEPLENSNPTKEREHIFMHMYDPTMANMWIQAMALSGATLALDSAPTGLKTALLQRYSKELKKWQPRYCVIDDNFGAMAYYEVSGDSKYVLRGHIPLRATAVAQLKDPKHGRRNAFLVATKEADFFFAADTDSQMKEWISALVSAGVHAMPPQ